LRYSKEMFAGAAENLALRQGDMVAFGPEHVADTGRPPRDYVVEKYGASFLRTDSCGIASATSGCGPMADWEYRGVRSRHNQNQRAVRALLGHHV
jgi:hypothetical protein